MNFLLKLGLIKLHKKTFYKKKNYNFLGIDKVAALKQKKLA